MKVNVYFIDEASFHINLKRNLSWSRKGARARVKTPKRRAPTHTILGAICAHGVVNICIKRPRVVPEQEANATKKKENQQEEAHLKFNPLVVKEAAHLLVTILIL